MPYYHAQMQCFMALWDARNNQGEGMEVVDFCCQVISVASVSLYHSMANVQSMVWLFDVVAWTTFD